VLDCFDQPFRLDGTGVVVGTSVGVAVHAGGSGSADALLRTSDADMYRHKHARQAGVEGPEPAGS
jgi:GGDEF domain-containing protein